MRLDPKTADAETLLEALATGDIAADDPAVTARLSRDPSLAARWSQLRAITSLLGRTADEERATLNAALAPAPRARSRTGPWLWVSLAAAAAIVTLVLRATLAERPLHVQDTHLGERAVACLAPVRGVTAYQSFEARAPIAGGGWCTFRVFDDTRAAATVPLAESGRVVATTWTPDLALLATLPLKIRWTVEAFDASGALSGSDEARAWRVP